MTATKKQAGKGKEEREYGRKTEESCVLWNGWKTEALVGKGTSGEVYRITREEVGEKRISALKVIRVPSGEQELLAMRAQGLSEEEIRQSLLKRTLEVSRELAVLCSLKGCGNIVSYEDQAVFQGNGCMEWEICLQMEMLTPLSGYLEQHAPSPEDILRLGIHISRALLVCETRHLVHRDIKPENIFVSETGDFKLGDFGIAALEETFSAAEENGTAADNASDDPPEAEDPEKYKTENSHRQTEADALAGTRRYLAPEVLKDRTYSFLSDQYALGVTLKELSEQYLKGEGKRQQAKESYRQKAFFRVIRKMLSEDPGKRFQSARELCLQMEGLTGENRWRNDSNGHRSRILLIIVLAGMLALAGRGIFLLQKDPEQAGKYPAPVSAGSTQTAYTKEVKRETDEGISNGLQGEGTEKKEKYSGKDSGQEQSEAGDLSKGQSGSGKEKAAGSGKGKAAETGKEKAAKSGKGKASETGKEKAAKSGKGKASETGKGKAAKSGKGKVSETGKDKASGSGKEKSVRTRKEKTAKSGWGKTETSGAKRVRKNQPDVKIVREKTSDTEKGGKNQHKRESEILERQTISSKKNNGQKKKNRDRKPAASSGKSETGAVPSGSSSKKRKQAGNSAVSGRSIKEKKAAEESISGWTLIN